MNINNAVMRLKLAFLIRFFPYKAHDLIQNNLIHLVCPICFSNFRNVSWEIVAMCPKCKSEIKQG